MIIPSSRILREIPTQELPITVQNFGVSPTPTTLSIYRGTSK